MFGTREIMGIVVPFFIGVVVLLVVRGRAGAVAALGVGTGVRGGMRWCWVG